MASSQVRPCSFWPEQPQVREAKLQSACGCKGRAGMLRVGQVRTAVQGWGSAGHLLPLLLAVRSCFILGGGSSCVKSR